MTSPLTRKYSRRSLFGTVVWSLLTLGLAAMAVWFTLDYGWELPGRYASDTLRSIEDKESAIAQGGAVAWWVWAVVQLGFCALVLAVAVAMLRDYFVYFRLKAGRLLERLRAR